MTADVVKQSLFVSEHHIIVGTFENVLDLDLVDAVHVFVNVIDLIAGVETFDALVEAFTKVYALVFLGRG